MQGLCSLPGHSLRAIALDWPVAYDEKAMARPLSLLAGLVLVGILLLACQKGGAVAPQVVQRGQSLYQTYCITCHGGIQGDTRVPYAPPHTSAGHTWHHPDGQLKEIILNGYTYRGTMPAFRGILSEEDVEAILAYIKTWWGEQERAYQAEVSRLWEAQRRSP
ncbi:hypothetical protein HRbin23_00214 [bacterium HR23]|nr:hypothetical protein HRbin23_00214 [bacterium HR23]